MTTYRRMVPASEAKRSESNGPKTHYRGSGLCDCPLEQRGCTNDKRFECWPSARLWLLRSWAIRWFLETARGSPEDCCRRNGALFSLRRKAPRTGASTWMKWRVLNSMEWGHAGSVQFRLLWQRPAFALRSVPGSARLSRQPELGDRLKISGHESRRYRTRPAHGR